MSCLNKRDLKSIPICKNNTAAPGTRSPFTSSCRCSSDSLSLSLSHSCLNVPLMLCRAFSFWSCLKETFRDSYGKEKSGVSFSFLCLRWIRSLRPPLDFTFETPFLGTVYVLLVIFSAGFKQHGKPRRYKSLDFI